MPDLAQTVPTLSVGVLIPNLVAGLWQALLGNSQQFVLSGLVIGIQLCYIHLPGYLFNVANLKCGQLH